MEAVRRYNLSFGIKNGFRVARQSTVEDSLTDFLESDLESVESSQLALELIMDHTSNSVPSESTGNATLLRVYPDHVEIENLWDEERAKVKLSKSEFIEIVTAWADFLRSPKSEE